MRSPSARQNNKARVMEKRVARQVGIVTTAMEERVVMMAVLKGKKPRKKMFNINAEGRHDPVEAQGKGRSTYLGGQICGWEEV